MKLMASARKQGLFLAVKDKMTALARKRGVFMAAEMADKKRDTPKGCLCSYLVIRFLDSLRSLEMTVGR